MRRNHSFIRVAREGNRLVHRIELRRSLAARSNHRPTNPDPKRLAIHNDQIVDMKPHLHIKGKRCLRRMSAHASRARLSRDFEFESAQEIFLESA